MKERINAVEVNAVRKALAEELKVNAETVVVFDTAFGDEKEAVLKGFTAYTLHCQLYLGGERPIVNALIGNMWVEAELRTTEDDCQAVINRVEFDADCSSVSND